MRQLVGDELPAVMRRLREAARGEDDVVAHRVGAGIHVPGRRRCLSVGVDPHAREVVAEPRFHVLTEGVAQRPARPGESAIDALRSLP